MLHILLQVQNVKDRNKVEEGAEVGHRIRGAERTLDPQIDDSFY